MGWEDAMVSFGVGILVFLCFVIFQIGQVASANRETRKKEGVVLAIAVFGLLVCIGGLLLTYSYVL